MADLLTTAEAAKRLRYTAATVRAMIARGELRAEWWGRQWRVPEDALVKSPLPEVAPRQSRAVTRELEMWRARKSRVGSVPPRAAAAT